MGVRRIQRPLQEACCWVCGRDANGRQLVTIREAAEFCRVSINCIYRWMERGLIEWVYNAGGKRRIYKDSLIRQPEDEQLNPENGGLRTAGGSETNAGDGW